MLTLAHIEIQHPSRIGTQLVKARIERVRQRKLTTRIAALPHNDTLAFNNQSVRRQQLHIGHAAHISLVQIVGTQHVSFIPQRVANEIALVVRMHIYLFLNLLATQR